MFPPSLPFQVFEHQDYGNWVITAELPKLSHDLCIFKSRARVDALST